MTLVIIIIILLILSGIVLNIAIGKKRIFNVAKQATQTYKMQAAKEKLELAILYYQTNKENTTLLEEIRKIDGLEKITTNDGELPYILIIDGFEFKIDEILKVIYQGEKKETKNEAPEIIVEYENEEVYNLSIDITVKTKDSLGLKEIIVSKKIANGTEEKYQDIKVEKVTGQEKNMQVQIPMNGNYVIQAYGQNGTLTKREITISNIKEGNVLASISAGTIIDNHVLLTINGKSEGSPIKQIELYVGGKSVKIYEYKDNQEEKEELYTLENIEFYKDTPCYVKVINTREKEATSVEIIVSNKKVIANVKDLENFSTQVNLGNTFSGKNIFLIDEITTNANWIPIGYYDGSSNWGGRYFAGTFEGNNHVITVKNLSKDNKYKSSGLFGMIKGGTINNLEVSGVMDAPTDFVGGITGAINTAIIYNCTNNAKVTSTQYKNHGGIVGYCKNSSIQNCNNKADICGKTMVGGIVGNSDSDSQSDSKVIKCTNSGKIVCYGVEKVTWGESNANYGVVGGIVGMLINTQVENSINTGEVTGNTTTILPDGIVAGGITGWSDNSYIKRSNNKALIAFSNTSTIKSYGGALGGIAGGLISSNIDECYNIGTITSKNNSSYGRNNIGGIAGHVVSSSIKNVYNTGTVNGKENIGGIVGASVLDSSISGNNYIYNCYNASENITGEKNVGNIAGRGENVISNHISYIQSKAPLGTNVNSKWENYEEYTLTQMKTMNSGLLTLISKDYGNGLWSQNTTYNDKLPYLINNVQ